MKRTVLILGAIVALGATAALTLPPLTTAGAHGGHSAGHGHGHGGFARHGHRGPRLLPLLEAYDADGDDALSQSEIDQGRAEQLARFDSDEDGQLSLAEYEALWLEAMRERMVDRFQSHDDDGDGRITQAEFSERTGRLVTRFDRNGDGVLSIDDRRHRGQSGESSERPAE